MKLSIECYERAFGAPGEMRYEFSDDDNLIGVASVSSNEASHFLHFITVMPDDRGKGYGSLILKILCEKFNDKPIWLELDDSSPFGLDNLRAWYERHGFTQVFGDYMVREVSHNHGVESDCTPDL
ncbi:MAG TPA: GNAT family N-acetyltransferase [Cyanophyceae cyanobacterium]